MKARAFSLIEVLVVTAILSVLVAIGYSIGTGVKKKADLTTCTSHLRLLHNALLVYRSEWGNAQSNVGDMGRLGLPPSLLRHGSGGEPLVGELSWMICPAPKQVPYYYVPQYETFFWPNVVLGVEFRPRYVDVTAKYKDRTPSIYDLNHNNHADEVLTRPRTKKLLLFVDLGGRLTSKYVTGRMTSMGDVEFFELH
jgi:prepilin-type N-terminal cleavage/methylation domain-containing protein